MKISHELTALEATTRPWDSSRGDMACISTGELAWAFSQGQSLSWQTLGMGWEGLCPTCPRGLLCSCVSGEQWQSGGGGGGGHMLS